MKKVILILGGARSGKSKYAVKLAKDLEKKVAFIATATCFDDEMKRRIKMHRSSRPRHWKLIEGGRNVSSILLKLKDKYELILIDCLGLFISNLLADDLGDKEIEKRLKTLIRIISEVKITIILVSNEVGMGIVPDNFLARRFRDLVGFANQKLGQYADEVIFMQSGIPIKIKNENRREL